MAFVMGYTPPPGGQLRGIKLLQSPSTFLPIATAFNWHFRSLAGPVDLAFDLISYLLGFFHCTDGTAEREPYR